MLVQCLCASDDLRYKVVFPACSEKKNQDRRRGEEMACIDDRTTATKINYSKIRRDTFIKVYAFSMDYNLKFHSLFTDYLLFTSQIILCKFKFEMIA